MSTRNIETNNFLKFILSGKGLTFVTSIIGLSFGVGMYIQGLLDQLENYEKDFSHYQEMQDLKSKTIIDRLDGIEKRVNLIEEKVILYEYNNKKN